MDFGLHTSKAILGHYIGGTDYAPLYRRFAIIENMGVNTMPHITLIVAPPCLNTPILIHIWAIYRP